MEYVVERREADGTWRPVSNRDVVPSIPPYSGPTTFVTRAAAEKWLLWAAGDDLDGFRVREAS